ncbi:MAG: hypothetical protein COX02_00520 [Candidatus Vogelbacteria bacterium CG22_combo_CG10-13_8_21_14_all_37_9]|uniref:Phosphoribosyltransferase domain-containing protein n=1 Tax=Candidatus Vogelbacteria bacterium CG22_combo_CG10-13_8_21_14_all_37_9 TaxID=1975046 RepID=A0A2H0BL41_9BACT|nr:MAG: hypothetical protein COX02_00520 [Candidatus Vogelbacteria bacterium CG22_combo_CG10-13_8_21_14_all_37_9]
MTKFLLNFFFPLHCLACGSEGHLACPSCRKKIPPTENPDDLIRAKIFAISDYRDPLVQALVRVLKYQGWKIASLEIAELILESTINNPNSFLSSLLTQKISPPSAKILLVPVPLSPWRRFRRGYNQAELIAKNLVQLKPDLFELRTDLVKKIRHTKSQVEIQERHKRLKNLTGAFELVEINKQNLKDRTILLLDDVTTTGTTFQELKKLFHHTQVKEVICLAFAHG